MRRKTAQCHAWSISTPLGEDTRLELVTEKDPEALKVVPRLRRACAGHGGAGVVSRNQAGPRSRDRLRIFYDFYREQPFTEADLAAIEAKMAEVVARDEVRARIRAAR
jgi:threonyl-tRNA synthetase